MNRSQKIAAALTLMLASGAANADMGVPMLFLTLPMLIVALVPVVLLETFVLLRRLGGPFREQLGRAAAANLASTLVGIPVTWFLLLLLQMATGGGQAYGLQTLRQKFLAVTWQAPWLIPYESDLNWMIPAASLALLIPFFVGSLAIEIPIVVHMARPCNSKNVSMAVIWANVVSYTFLVLCGLVWLAWGLDHPTH